MPRLIVKICVVTGCERGIGPSIAAAFQAEGARVIATDKDVAAGEAAAAAIGCRFVRLDVRVEPDWEALEASMPDVDVVVNNAGVTGFEDGVVAHDPEHASLEDWRAVHRVNLDGTFWGAAMPFGR